MYGSHYSVTGKYIQGANVIARLGDYLKPMANNWLVVGDKFVLGFAEETLRKKPDGCRFVSRNRPVWRRMFAK